MMSSNGLASGNHLLEAISHGLCEVVERHSSALFHVEVAAGAADRRRLDLESVEDPLCLEVLDRFAQAGIAVAAWDITVRGGDPVRDGARSWTRGGRPRAAALRDERTRLSPGARASRSCAP